MIIVLDKIYCAYYLEFQCQDFIITLWQCIVLVHFICPSFLEIHFEVIFAEKAEASYSLFGFVLPNCLYIRIKIYSTDLILTYWHEPTYTSICEVLEFSIESLSYGMIRSRNTYVKLGIYLFFEYWREVFSKFQSNSLYRTSHFFKF